MTEPTLGLPDPVTVTYMGHVIICRGGKIYIDDRETDMNLTQAIRWAIKNEL